MSAPRHWDQDKDSTLYIGNLDERCTDRIIWELMLQAGPIINVHLPKDRVTQSHQGYGFVEFADEAAADYGAKIMNQVRLFGKPIRVNKATADKRNTAGGPGGDGASQGVGAELFVGNLDTMVDEKTLYDTFSRFGPLVAPPKITRDDANLSKGYGFVSYASFEASDDAIHNMNGQYLSNKEITVQYAYKKDGKGERHGDDAERALAAQAKKHGVQVAIPAMPASLVGVPNAPNGPSGMNGAYGGPQYGNQNQAGQMPPPPLGYHPGFGHAGYHAVPPPVSLSGPNTVPMQASWSQQQPPWYPPQSGPPSMPGYYGAQSGWPPQPQTPGYYPPTTTYGQQPGYGGMGYTPTTGYAQQPTYGTMPNYAQQQQGYYQTPTGYSPQPQSYQGGVPGYSPQQQTYQGAGIYPPPPRQAPPSRRAASPGQKQNSAYQAPSTYNVKPRRSSNSTPVPPPAAAGLPARPPVSEVPYDGPENPPGMQNVRIDGSTGGRGRQASQERQSGKD